MRIFTTRRVCAALMEKYDIDTKYGLAKLMDVNKNSVSNWLDHGRSMNERQAKKAADLLGIEYESILIGIQFERNAKNSAAARAWQKIAENWDASHFAAFALSALVINSTLPYLIPASYVA